MVLNGGYWFAVFLLQVLHPALRELELCECSISDEGLASLCICKNLRKLDLNATKNSRENITSEGVYGQEMHACFFPWNRFDGKNTVICMYQLCT